MHSDFNSFADRLVGERISQVTVPNSEAIQCAELRLHTESGKTLSIHAGGSYLSFRSADPAWERDDER
jgi:hypothetical protein